jgi:hypothetical protein
MGRRAEGIMQPFDPLLKKWTAEDDERLRSMAAAGYRPHEIAEKLNRSEAAVRSRAWQQGISLRLILQKRRYGREPKVS